MKSRSINKKMFPKALAVFAAYSAVFPNLVFAQRSGGTRGTEELVGRILCPIFNTMFSVFIILSTIIVVYAAYLYLASGGDTEKVSKATKTITYAAVGILVALVSKGFPIIVASFFGTTISGGC